MVKVRWYVKSGPDNSHLVDTRFKDRLCDARQYADELPLTPNGELRPYEIHRVTYENVSPRWEKMTSDRIIEERKL